MSATPTVLDPEAEAAAFIAHLIDQDPRDQKDIAAAAGISPGQVTHLKSGDRRLTDRMARKLGRVYPDHADRLAELAEAVDDAASMRRATLPGLLDRLMSGLAPTFA